MANGDKFWYRTLFRVKIYEASGDSFQRLVNELCQHSISGFQAISPWGNWGDGGNDGWVQEEQHYLQVYGPKPTPYVRIVVVFFEIDNWGRNGHNYATLS
jgi:hypothetical protein